MTIHFQIEKDNNSVGIICDGGRVGVVTDWYLPDAKVATYKPLGIAVIHKIMKEFDLWVKRQEVEQWTFHVTVAILKNSFDSPNASVEDWLQKTIRRDHHVCGVQVIEISTKGDDNDLLSC